jgi:membrane protease YdiL (CAAX protease family)
VRVVSGWPARGDPLAGYAAAIAVAYLEAPRPDPDVLSATLDALGPGWFADALALRLAARLDEPAVAGAARRAIEARASPLLARLRALAVLDLLVVGLGLVAAVPLLRRRAPPRAVSEARLPPPWTLGAGLAVLVRGGALGALLLLVLLVGAPWLTADPALMGALDQPAMCLPVLLLARRVLLAPAGLGVREAFGLRLRPGGGGAAARATLALLAAGILLDLALSLLGERLGFTVHWAEWFDPDLAWGPAAAVAVTVSGSVLFAPVFEELTFRGLLYGSLRARLAWPAAAALSALIFGAAHGYGLAGFLSVLASGILWAWVYERTGSLLPAIAAHVVNNAAVAATLLTLLR